MKSRVEKNKELHKKINQTIDESVNSEALSHYANRLNEIDDQFERMDTPSRTEPKRAKESTTNLDIFDTFENEYLKDFLDEVKAYNVEKGYRSSQDTNENILEELNLIDKEIDPVIETEENVFWEEYQHDFINPVENDLDLSNEKDFVLESKLDVEDPISEEEILSEDDITREILKLTETDENDFEFEVPTDFEIENDVIPSINIDIEENIDLHVDDKSQSFSANTDKETDLESVEKLQSFSIDLEDEDSEQEYLDEDSEQVYLDENTVAKYRAVNAIVSVALMAALLGLAIAIRYIVLN